MAISLTQMIATPVHVVLRNGGNVMEISAVIGQACDDIEEQLLEGVYESHQLIIEIVAVLRVMKALQRKLDHIPDPRETTGQIGRG